MTSASEDAYWTPGQKAIFTGNNGKTAPVTIVSGERVNAIGGSSDVCMEVIFEDGKAYLVRARQLRIA